MRGSSRSLPGVIAALGVAMVIVALLPLWRAYHSVRTIQLRFDDGRTQQLVTQELLLELEDFNRSAGTKSPSPATQAELKDELERLEALLYALRWGTSSPEFLKERGGRFLEIYRSIFAGLTVNAPSTDLRIAIDEAVIQHASLKRAVGDNTDAAAVSFAASQLRTAMYTVQQLLSSDTLLGLEEGQSLSASIRFASWASVGAVVLGVVLVLAAVLSSSRHFRAAVKSSLRTRGERESRGTRQGESGRYREEPSLPSKVHSVAFKQVCAEVWARKLELGSIAQHFASFSEPLCVVNAQGEITATNASFSELVGDADSQSLGDLFNGEEGFLPGQLQFRGETARNLRTKISGAEGSPISVILSVLRVGSKPGVTDGWVYVFQNAPGGLDNRDQPSAVSPAGDVTFLRNDLVAAISHEIRTPLNGVLGMLNLLAETGLDELQQEYVGTARKSGELLVELIDTILDYSKLESGSVELDRTPFSVTKLLEDLGDVLAPKAHEKGLELAFIVERDVPARVKGDPSRLRQVLVNLLGNAIKYTSSGHVFTRVSFAEMAEDSLKLRFDVVDSGVGIARGRMTRLFDTFAHGDASSSVQFSGAGLGLAICKRLVEVMGGEIRCSSEVGRGTTFSFTVVLAHAEERSDSEQLKRSQLLHGRRIFLVDSSEVGRAAIRETLLQWGCEVLEAASGKEVFESVASDREGPLCHVALVSWSLADGDAMVFGKKFRAHPALRGIPLILLSVNGQPVSSPAVDEVFTSGLVKPIKQKHLFNAIAAVIGIKPLADESRVMKTPRHRLEQIVKQQLFRILVVEDNLVNQRVAVRMIERLGYGCEVAMNGLEALEKVQESRYDLIFMDCQMPEMDGFAATSHIRGIEAQEGTRTPIIAMTALVMEGDRERCLAVGMDDYITKPLKLEEVREKLGQYLPEKDLEESSYLLQ